MGADLVAFGKPHPSDWGAPKGILAMFASGRKKDFCPAVFTFQNNAEAEFRLGIAGPALAWNGSFLVHEFDNSSHRA